ncbi:MAG: hypothetical protein LBC20_04560, partial [Planctomycetaceae bacterium]|nr:hypothetical protein [Planctomycetaceae bacterium]
MPGKTKQIVFLSQGNTCGDKKVNIIATKNRGKRRKRFGSLALATIVAAAALMRGDGKFATAQTQIVNGRHISGYNPNESQPTFTGSNYTVNGSAGTWDTDDTTKWFGLNDTNNATYWLSQLSATGGTVNIEHLDNTTTPVRYYRNWSYSLNSGTGYLEWSYSTVTVPSQGPEYKSMAYMNSFGNNTTITVGSGLTTKLTASYVTNATDSPNLAGVPLDQLFSFTNSTTGVIKAGDGKLSIQTNTYIAKFTGNAGILDVSGTTGGTDFARIDSGDVNLNGGLGTTGNPLSNYSDQRAGFTFSSGVAGNKWDIRQLNSTGFTTQGVMNVTNATDLNGTTTIEGALGQLTINEATRVGSTADTHIFNVINGGVFTSQGAFTVGKASAGGDSNLYLNVTGGTVTTNNSATIGTQTNDIVNGIISGSTWTNIGNFIVAQNSTDTKLSIESVSTLTSTGYISVGENNASNGTLNVSGSTVTTDDNIYVAHNNGATGTITATGSTTEVTAKKNIYVAHGDNTTGTFTATGNAKITASDGVNTTNDESIFVANGIESTGIFDADSAIVFADTDIHIANGQGSTGTFKAINKSTITANNGSITVAGADPSTSSPSKNTTGTFTIDNSVVSAAKNIEIARGKTSTVTVDISNSSTVTAGEDIFIATGDDSTGTFNIASSTVTATNGMIEIASGKNSNVSKNSTPFKITDSTITAKTDITIASGENSQGTFTISKSTITAQTGSIEIADGVSSTVTM